MFVLVLAFQNCGQPLAPGQDAAALEDRSLEDRGLSDLPIVEVTPIVKSEASEPTRVLLEGYFRSGCTGLVEPAVQSDGREHVVRAQTAATSGHGAANGSAAGTACTFAIVPFEVEVSLGQLPPGPHVVKYLSDEGPREIVLEVL